MIFYGTASSYLEMLKYYEKARDRGAMSEAEQFENKIIDYAKGLTDLARATCKRRCDFIGLKFEPATAFVANELDRQSEPPK